MIIDRLYEIVLVGSADTKSWFSDSDDSTSSCSDYESDISVSKTVSEPTITEKLYTPATNLSINTPTFEPTELKVNCQDQPESTTSFTTNQCDEDDDYLNMPKSRKLISRPVEVGDDEADDEENEAPKQRKLVCQLTEDESRRKIEEFKSNHVPAKQTKLMERPDTIRFNKKRPVVASGVGVVGADFRKKIAKEMPIINA